MEEVRFYFDRNHAKGFIIGCGFFLVFGILFIVISSTYPKFLFGEASFVGSLFIAGATYGLGMISFPFLSGRPALTLSAEGITDQTSRLARGFVPWSEVESCSFSSNSVVTIWLVPNCRNLNSGFLGKLLSHEISRQKIEIHCPSLNSKGEDIVFQVNTFLKSAHDTQPLG
jgi:hypothetical protein